MTKEITACQGFQAYQVFQAPEASVDYMACQAPKAFQDPQVQTSMETQVSQVLLERGVIQEKPTPFQALAEPQDRKASEELQGNEAQSGVQDFRGFQASRPLPTSLGYLVTQEHQGYLAWKVIEGPQGHLGLPLFLEPKEMRGTQELQETQGPKDGVGTPGPRAGLACLVCREKKGPEVSKDSWEIQAPLELWATEAQRDPKETEDSRVSPGLWDPQGLRESRRGLLSSRGQWAHREEEAPRGHREKWGLRVPQENQVSVGLRGRQVPREEVVCLLFLDSEETKGPWGTRGQLARKGSQAARGPLACPACLAAASALATSW